MRILWLTNIELPIISINRNRTINPLGGWLTGMLSAIEKNKEYRITIVYPDKNESNELVYGCINENIEYFSFPQKHLNKNYFKFLHNQFEIILAKVNPDIIHIHGTEYSHSAALAKLAYGKIPTIVSIQGLISEAYRYYDYGVPLIYRLRMTPHSLLNRSFIQYDKLSLYKRIKYERITLRNCDYIVGRTDWDRAYSTFYSPDSIYYHCNETLRDGFYDKKWDYRKCTKNTIFVSQTDNPLKGFHWLLHALFLAKKKNSSIKVFATGIDKNPKTCASKSKLTEYQRYIYMLIKKYNLEDNVCFVGILNEIEMQNHLLNCNLFVIASNCENSPNSLGEAMLMGVPCIAADVGGISSMLVHKTEGLIYRNSDVQVLANYIIELLENSDIAIEYGENARRHAIITHNQAINLNKILELYDNMYTNNRRK